MIIYNRTALIAAVEKGKIEIVENLLENKDIDVNIPYVKIFF